MKTVRSIFNKQGIDLIPSATFDIHSHRIYGQAKLNKPVILKGIKQICSISYIGKCKCPVFISENDIYIQHKDYFSPSLNIPVEDMGAPLSYIINKYHNKDRYVKGFVYSDAWGSIVLRQEAWLKFSGILENIKEYNNIQLTSIAIGLMECYHGLEESELCCTGMERFFENVFSKLKEAYA